jgi:methionine synthase II (cobalamin-independent)
MLKPFLTTGIGSLPHLDALEATRLILDTFDIPFWPQLPALSFREFMVPQYSEGLPFLQTDIKKEAIWIERNSSDELERFYESWTEGSRIAISEDYAKGLHTFLDVIKDRSFNALKGHITGPLTFTLGLKDSSGKPVYFDEELRELSLMLLKAKTRWQMDQLKPHAGKVIIFIDEPILSALGSSGYLGVSGAEASRLLTELVDVIRNEGGISGVHCCGNADWPMVINCRPDMINFDAYDYADTLTLYPGQFRTFLERGGCLAWGAVPTSDAIRGENPESIQRRFRKGVEKLAVNIPLDLIYENILLTPSCGTGYRTIAETLKIFQLLMRLKEEYA